MAKTHERLCVSVPTALIEDIRASYPHMDFSPLLSQLLMYAHDAGFMQRLRKDVQPSNKRLGKGRERDNTTEALLVVALDDTTCELEEFGA